MEAEWPPEAFSSTFNPVQPNQIQCIFRDISTANFLPMHQNEDRCFTKCAYQLGCRHCGFLKVVGPSDENAFGIIKSKLADSFGANSDQVIKAYSHLNNLQASLHTDLAISKDSQITLWAILADCQLPTPRH